jgi:putative SOS response-associated peptidase YedK
MCPNRSAGALDMRGSDHVRPLRQPPPARGNCPRIPYRRTCAQPGSELERGSNPVRDGGPKTPETGERRLDALKWGLIPHFAKDLKAARKPINARSETAGTSGMFRGALASRRCIVPADAFYEWRAMGDGKQPYAIARRDGEPLAFAGLWEGWRSPDGETLRTFAILTTSANAIMSAIHERMPVILEPADWHAWLDGGDELLRPAGSDVLQMWPVSRAVNNVRNNGAELLDRIDDPHAPPPSDAPAGSNPT